MTVDVKICGLKTPETLDAALSAGADYVGLMFFGPSPRNIAPDKAQALADRVAGRAQTVAVFVDPEDELIRRVIDTVSPDMIQLHGMESVDRIEEIRKLCGAKVMKAIKVATPEDVAEAAAFAGHADRILFDAKAALGADKTLPGGNGLRFDWRILEAHDRRQPWMLSGGLDARNVAVAIEATGATAVDVSSGIERTPGEKDPSLIRAFVAAAKAAVPAMAVKGTA